MEGSADDASPRRIRIASILTATSAVAAIPWVSFWFSLMSEKYETIKVPMSYLTLLFVSISPTAAWAIALGLGTLLCLKDLWLAGRSATTLNYLAAVLLFFFVMLALSAIVLPFFSIIEQ